MPCSSDHMEPTRRERAITEAAKVFIIVNKKLNRQSDDELLAVANSLYPSTQRDYVGELCEILRHLDKGTFEHLVYNPRDRESRRIADWWEDHEKEDAERKRIEAVNAADEKDITFLKRYPIVLSGLHNLLTKQQYGRQYAFMFAPSMRRFDKQKLIHDNFLRADKEYLSEVFNSETLSKERIIQYRRQCYETNVVSLLILEDVIGLPTWIKPAIDHSDICIHLEKDNDFLYVTVLKNRGRTEYKQTFTAPLTEVL